ncbi:MAG TPA: hypothetical protein DEG96_08100 [Candidatus Atribacteria bacterium]|nr:hypothetical protein [Candidatus Atribacteria bacterium]
MLIRGKSKKEEKEKVIISFAKKLGIVCLRSLEDYIRKNKIEKCYIIIPHPPHPNVIDYVENISVIEMIFSSDFEQKIEEIKKINPNNTIEIINLEDFGERNFMRDAV